MMPASMAGYPLVRASCPTYLVGSSLLTVCAIVTIPMAISFLAKRPLMQSTYYLVI